MTRVVFSFPTTHAAFAAEDALRAAGIALQVIPLPTWLAAGCGLALRMDESVRGEAEDELQRHEIRYSGVHPEPR